MTRTSLPLINPHCRPSAPTAPAFPDQQITRQLSNASLLIAPLSGASQDGRQSRPQTRTNFIQHLDGGLATEIYAKEGDFVCAGEPLVRLDGRDIAEELKGTEAELAAKKSQLDIDKNSMFGCEGR